MLFPSGSTTNAGVVSGGITLGGMTQSRPPVVDAAGFDGGQVEGVDLCAALRREGGVLPRAVRVEAVNPENRTVDAVPDAISSFVLGKLHDAAEAKYPQGSVIEGGGPDDVRDSNAGVINRAVATCQASAYLSCTQTYLVLSDCLRGSTVCTHFCPACSQSPYDSNPGTLTTVE